MKHRDLAGDLADEGHVVFNDDDTVFAGEAHEQFARARRLLVTHAGRGLIDQKELWILGEEHAYFEPLFLAVREFARFRFCLRGKADGSEDFVDTFALSGRDAGKERGPNGAAAFEREPNIFEDRVIDVDGGRLEFSADAEAVDLMFLELGEVGVAFEFDFAGVRPRASSDEVEERTFACAVGADDDTQLAFIHVEIEVGNGLEAVERFIDAFDGEDELLCHSRATGLRVG